MLSSSKASKRPPDQSPRRFVQSHFTFALQSIHQLRLHSLDEPAAIWIKRGSRFFVVAQNDGEGRVLVILSALNAGHAKHTGRTL
jgi:hypothetical protein